MILSDGSIIRAWEQTKLVIRPFYAEQIQPSSYDLTLAGEFYKSTEKFERQRMWLWPGQFLLGCTLEYFEIPDCLVGQIHGKSTLRRQGITVCCDAGYVDPGFKGQLTLEIFNHSRSAFSLVAGMRIGQISFIRLDQPAERPYGSPELQSHYQFQAGVTPAKIDA